MLRTASARRLARSALEPRRAAAPWPEREGFHEKTRRPCFRTPLIPGRAGRRPPGDRHLAAAVVRPRGQRDGSALQSVRRQAGRVHRLRAGRPHVCDLHQYRPRPTARRRADGRGKGEVVQHHHGLRRNLYAGQRKGRPPRRHLMEPGLDGHGPGPFYKLAGDTLTITTAPYKSYADGQEGRSILVWKKVQ